MSKTENKAEMSQKENGEISINLGEIYRTLK